jgi:hypothetical protein
VESGAVDLADRGGRDRLCVELGEDLGDRLLELLLDHLLHVLEADLRGRVAQLAELALELLAVLLGDQADVEERHHLAQLHGRALHRPQRGHDLLGGLDLALLERLGRALVGAGDVGGLGARLPHRLRGGDSPDPGGPANAAGGNLVLGHARDPTDRDIVRRWHWTRLERAVA